MLTALQLSIIGAINLVILSNLAAAQQNLEKANTVALNQPSEQTNSLPACLTEECIKKLLHRLAGDDIKGFLGFLPHVVLSSSTAPIAFALGERTIIINSGLMQYLATEDEVAFLLAHELSHLLLNHTNGKRYFAASNKRTENDHAMEVQADLLAQKLILAAKFNPHAPVELLNRIIDAKSHSLAPLSMARKSDLIDRKVKLEACRADW